MKTLFFGIVLIILIGFAGFFYRNVAERTGGPQQVACTADAKVCPDGTAVGRSGPACEFMACPFPNVELADIGVSFVVPQGYAIDESGPASDPALLARLLKPSASASVAHAITVRRYLISEGESADDVMLANTRYQPAGLAAEDFSRFETSLINGREVRSTVVERFEALVQSQYYLARENDVLIFSVTEHDVTDWTDASLDVEELPEHQALLSLVASLQTAP